ncbi:MAG: phosphonopyruvate decarboxylase [Candidatus Electryonea clarkiae]|nr:phosphonopyruvate decarboxylase [Candidatus Electryonea clarkiae]MDP8286778.1 phosphonopyruvate decarboxylase [Candidatus Electryonea clarkiae]
MIECSVFYNHLTDRNIDFYTGVPDSLLKNICSYISDHTSEDRHITAANEGGAIALASGHYLATGNPALVYMQNSGLGNSVNPLISLADPEVYGIPMLLLIGWRGMPNVKDEPQHVKQGKVTLGMLEVMGIPYRVLSKSDSEFCAIVDELLQESLSLRRPVALVVEKGTFDDYSLQNIPDSSFSMSREEAVKLVANELGEEDIIVSTTGKCSRELYEYRDSVDGNHDRDFLTVGSMGHASLIAMGIALDKPSRLVICMDGDGAALMHLGAMSTIGTSGLKNYKHIILNNGSHESVGGQPTAGYDVSFCEIASGCGYKETWSVETYDELHKIMPKLKSCEGPVLLEIKVKNGSRADLGRPSIGPRENKERFMEHLR